MIRDCSALAILHYVKDWTCVNNRIIIIIIIITILSLFNALSIFHTIPYLPFFFLCRFTGRTPDGWWLTRRVLTRERIFCVCEWRKNTSRGSMAPKTVAFFRPSREIWPKLWWSITFKRYDLATYLYRITYRDRCHSFWICNNIQPTVPPGGDIWTSLPMSDAFIYRLLENWARNRLKCELWQLGKCNRHSLYRFVYLYAFLLQ